MYYKSLLTALVMAACLSGEVAAKGGNKGGNNKGGQQSAAAAQQSATPAAQAGGAADQALALNPAAVATGSAQDGSQGASA
jgi:hypothetical protein